MGISAGVNVKTDVDYDVIGPIDELTLSKYKFNKKLNNFRSSEKQQEAIKKILQKNSISYVYAAYFRDEIIGYIMFVKPDKENTFSRHDKVLEVCIEVSKDWRKKGVAKSLVKAAAQNKELENYIIVGMAVSRNWDVDNVNLTPEKYSKILRKLCVLGEGEEHYTSNAEMDMTKNDILLVRYGKNITETEKSMFQILCFFET